LRSHIGALSAKQPNWNPKINDNLFMRLLFQVSNDIQTCKCNS
jgi:hypothetical protein